MAENSMAIQKPARAGSPHNFQELVSEYLVRHRSVLDVMSKFQEATARVNRALVKSVTACGCLQVNAQRQTIPLDISLHELKKHMDTHLTGAPCEQCREVLEAELGNNLFYLVALCDLLQLDFAEIMGKEEGVVSTLGIYHFS
jgi:hypothetical protein